MAVRSRPSIPAVPTVVGATDDSSRGGLFSRSNLANPVSGADVNGVPIQDSTITFTINGEAFTGNSFTLNQDNDQTIDFIISGAGGGTADGNNFVTGGSISDGTLTLTRQGLDDITIPGISAGGLDMAAVQALITAAINALPDPVQTVNGMAPDAAGNVQVSTAITLSSFENSDTVQFSAGDTDTSDVQATATPTWIGNTNRGGTTGTVQATSITLDASTNLILRNDGNGSYTITVPQDAPTAPTERSNLNPIPRDVFTAPVPPEVTVTVSGGTITGMSNDDTGIQPRITRDNNAISGQMAPTISVNGDRTMATITFDADDADEEGMYEITVMTPITPTGGGDTVTLSTTETFDRLVPFFQSRTLITSANIRNDAVVTDTGEEWDGSFNAIAGSGTLYFAVRTSDFSGITNGEFTTIIAGFMTDVRFAPIGNTFSINDHNGDPITFQTYRTGNIMGGQSLSNFRTRT